MSITFIIGNGFDKNCGLNSDCKDVYKEYCKHENNESDIIKKFKEDIEKDITLWSDFEEKMSKYANELDDENQFIECVDNFSEFLRGYLLNQQEIFKNRIDAIKDKEPIYKELKESIDEFYDGLTNNASNKVRNGIISHGRIVRIISFNYTNSLEIVNNVINSNLISNITHIHGTLENNDIVLGMDNVGQLNNIKYKFTTKGQRHFIKPFFNEQFDRTRVYNAKKIFFTKCVHLRFWGFSWRV